MARQTPSETDLSLLSAYLDGELSESERARLEARLDADAALQAELESLRQTVTLVRSLPQLRPPRNFTLDPAEYAGRRPGNRWLALGVPMIATGATLLLVAVCAGVLLIGGVGVGGSAAPVAREVTGAEVAQEEAAPEEEAAQEAAPASEMAEEETEAQTEARAPEVAEAEEAPAEEAAAEPAAEAEALEQAVPAGTPTALPTLSAELAAPPAGETGGQGAVGAGPVGAGALQEEEAADEVQPGSLTPEGPSFAQEPNADLSATATQGANQAQVATATLSAGVPEATQVAEGALPGAEAAAQPQPAPQQEAARAPRPYLLIGLGIGLAAVLGVVLISAGVGIVVANRSR